MPRAGGGVVGYGATFGAGAAIAAGQAATPVVGTPAPVPLPAGAWMLAICAALGTFLRRRRHAAWS